MAAETVKFKMGDNEFELPEIDDLDMSEWELVYDNTGLILADFAPEIDENGKLDQKAESDRQRRVSQPAFTRTMLQIALRRANPDMPADEVAEIATHARLVSVLEAIGEEVDVEDADAGPPESTPEPEPSSSKSSDDSNGNGSTDSTASSVEQVGLPIPTGTSG